MEQQHNEPVLANYLTAKDAAAQLNVCAFTLRRWRKADFGPKPFKIGGRLYYVRSHIQAWLAQQVEQQQGG